MKIADRRTRVAVQATYLQQAQVALRRAITLEDHDDVRVLLTEAAATVSLLVGRNDRDFADIRTQEADVAAAALEG